MKRDLFKTANKLRLSRDSRPGNCNSVDLREEMNNLIFGLNGCTPQSILFILRRMRRDEKGFPIECVCKSKFAKEGSVDCPYCQGEGHLWDESWVLGRSELYTETSSSRKHTPAGILYGTYRVFYFPYNVKIGLGDKIVEVVLDEEGYPVSPLKILTIHMPEIIDEKRGDNGRIEYIAAYCTQNRSMRND